MLYFQFSISIKRFSAERKIPINKLFSTEFKMHVQIFGKNLQNNYIRDPSGIVFEFLA